jgi:hypothetical protein
MNRDLLNLESEVNCLKREKEIMDQQFNARKQQLLQMSSTAISGERHTELIRQMVELGSQHRRDSDKINTKIMFAIHDLNVMKRNQQH